MRRSAVLSGVRRERNLFSFVSEAWVGLLAPGRTRPRSVARLNAETRRFSICRHQDSLAELGLESAPGSPEDLDRGSAPR